MKKKALITGISGQDGSYLAELLLKRGYEVHGMVQRVALEDPEHKLWRLKSIADKVSLYPTSLENQAALARIVGEVQPDECYHLAAQSFVNYSFDEGFSTINTNINGTLFILGALKEAAPHCKIYFAGSSEMFGNPPETPQNEQTPFNPRSPYGISKVTGFHLTRVYREMHGLFACSGILFNHESPRRGFEFVTRKITHAVAGIKCGRLAQIRLGNLDATRDWGFSGDYVRAMWLILQQDNPGDFVIASGKSHTVREFAELAFREVDLDWQEHVVLDEKFFRPAEKHPLRGDYSKAERELDWRPRVAFEELVRMMVQADLELIRNGE